MERVHPDAYGNSTGRSASTHDSNANETPQLAAKPGPNAVKIFNLRSREDRDNMLQTTIQDWQAAKFPWPMDSIKAKNVHRSIFEMMVMDLVPFTEVNKPGFLRHHHRLVPNFTVGVITYV